MKSKTISKEIAAKIESWLISISDEALAKDLREGVIVTGGCITSMFLKEAVNDYDIYLSSPVLAFRLASFYAKQLEDADIILRCTFADGSIDDVAIDEKCPAKLERVEIYIPSAGVYKPELEENKAHQVAFISSNAITLTDKIQIILRFAGDSEEIHSNYDFAHATNYWTHETGLITNTKALECILSKELIYRGSKYPLSSIFRTRKFIQRGWSCHVGNYLKMAMQLNALDLTDVNVLREQLTGVDSAYLANLITALSGREENITADYVCKIIDRMLGETD